MSVADYTQANVIVVFLLQFAAFLAYGSPYMTILARYAADLFNISLTQPQEAAFAQYADALIEWNQRVNLTAITASDEIAVKHFLDSLTIATVQEMGAPLRVIDVGSGAGFPGIPLKIVYPQLQMTLLEATGKKIAFLDHVIQLLNLSNTRTLKARAEEAGQMRDQREGYDLALARAVARLPVLLEYLLPLVKVGGRCIAMKGKTAHAEAADSTRALKMLGGRLAHIHDFQLPNIEEKHHLVVVEKIAPTPIGFPRKPGTPSQKPL